MLNFSDPTARGYARLAGVLYLAIALVAGFAIGYVPGQFPLADPPALVAALTGQRGLYAAGIGGEAAIMVIEIVLTAMLYFMFKPVNATLSAAAALARFAEVTVMGAMMLFSAAALGFADPAGLPGLDGATSAALAALMLKVHDAGVWVWQIVFTLHLVLLGVLVSRSGRFPRLMGPALSLGAFGYLLDSLYGFAFPEAAWLGQVRVALLVLATLAELSFAAWLTFRGPRVFAAPALA